PSRAAVSTRFRTGPAFHPPLGDTTPSPAARRSIRMIGVIGTMSEQRFEANAMPDRAEAAPLTPPGIREQIQPQHEELSLAPARLCSASNENAAANAKTCAPNPSLTMATGLLS